MSDSMSDDHTPVNDRDEDDEFDLPDAPEDEAEAQAEELEADLETLQAENAELKDKLLRFAADAENTRRRAERDLAEGRAYAIQKFARELLGAADNLERAIAHAPKESGEEAVKSFIQGVELTEKELQSAFERNGLTKVAPAKGDKFDPHLHQAMMEQPGEDVAPGAIIQTMQPGYALSGRIVRPAMVVVAAKG